LPRNGVEELEVVAGIAAGSLRLQPSEFIESRKDEEAMARGFEERWVQVQRAAGNGCSGGQNRTGQDGQAELNRTLGAAQAATMSKTSPCSVA